MMMRNNIPFFLLFCREEVVVGEGVWIEDGYHRLGVRVLQARGEGTTG